MKSHVSVEDPDFTVVGHHLLTPIFQKDMGLPAEIAFVEAKHRLVDAARAVLAQTLLKCRWCWTNRVRKQRVEPADRQSGVSRPLAGKPRIWRSA
jgi:hypothetical protein